MKNKILSFQKHKSPDIICFDSVSSTNTFLKKYVLENKDVPEFTLVTAKSQTGGRGRGEKKFFSPQGSGIYMSLLLRPETSLSDALHITAMAGTAVSEALDSVCSAETRIKWVNDIIVGGKKAGGILCEGILGGAGYSAVIVGIGVNITPPKEGFGDLDNIACAVLEENKDEDLIPRLIARITDNICEMYADFGNLSFRDEYIKRQYLTGRKINVVTKDGTTPATALGLDPSLRLIVRYEDGSEGILDSGEVSTEIS